MAARAIPLGKEQAGPCARTPWGPSAMIILGMPSRGIAIVDIPSEPSPERRLIFSSGVRDPSSVSTRCSTSAAGRVEGYGVPLRGASDEGDACAVEGLPERADGSAITHERRVRREATTCVGNPLGLFIGDVLRRRPSPDPGSPPPSSDRFRSRCRRRDSFHGGSADYS